MPKKTQDLESRISELEENVKSNTKKSSSNRKMLTEMGKNITDFQEGVGEAVLPFQRFSGYLTAVILALAGIVVISVTAAKGFSNKDIEDHGYMIGGVLIGFAALMAIVVYYWTSYVSESSYGKVINAFMFERDLLKGR